MIILTEFDFKNELGPMPTYRHMCFNSDVIVKLVSKRQLIEEVVCLYIPPNLKHFWDSLPSLCWRLKIMVALGLRPDPRLCFIHHTLLVILNQESEFKNIQYSVTRQSENTSHLLLLQGYVNNKYMYIYAKLYHKFMI